MRITLILSDSLINGSLINELKILAQETGELFKQVIHLFQ